MSVTYNVNVGNESVFAAKDMIFGWTFWSEGNTPAMLAELSDDHLKVLFEIFSGPLHREIYQAVSAEEDKRKKAKAAALIGNVVIGGETFGVNPAIRRHVEDSRTDFASKPTGVLKDFTMPTARTFMVSGQVEVGGELDTLLKLFTNVWLPIPGSHSDFFIRGRGEKSHIQITMHQDENDVPEYFSLHVGGEFAQFRTKYMAGECDDAKRYPLGDNWCMGNRVVAALKSIGAW